MNSLKFLNKVSASYSPVDANAKSLRSFLLGITSNSYRNSNPTCKIDIKVSDVAKPSLDVEFKNGKKLSIKDTSKLTVNEINKDVWRVPKLLLEEEESKL